MDTSTLIIIVVGLLVLAAILGLAWGLYKNQRARRLRKRFGPEYEYTVNRVGDRRRAESELAERERRVKSLRTRPLTREESARFADSWHAIQTRFVDEPVGAIVDADMLVAEVMEARGYPADDFEERVACYSVGHPNAAESYRSAYSIAQQAKRNQASTEDLRQAMIYYREIFNDLLETADTRDEETEIQETTRWQRNRKSTRSRA